MLVKVLNNLEGVSCNPVEGALYAFPRITLPPKAVEAARLQGKAPDLYYCLQLLDETVSVYDHWDSVILWVCRASS